MLTACHFNDDKYEVWLSRVEHKIDRIIALITAEGKTLMALQDDVAKLEADQAALTAAVSGVVAALKAQTAEITDLKNQLASAGVDPALLTRLEAVSTAVEAQTTALQGATPAPPAPPAP
jgi:septal ring factor EnvC (AmiA/AmiB activator)